MDFIIQIAIWAAAIGVLVACIHELVVDPPNT